MSIVRMMREWTAVNSLPIVTFDFHNTLAHCDEWFELEVRELAPAFLHWMSDRGLAPPPADEQITRAMGIYRQIRQDVMQSGIEQDASTCLEVVCRDLGLHATKPEIDQGLIDLMYPTLASTSGMPGAVEAVRALRERGHRLAVVSSAIYHPFIIWTLEKLGISDEFELVVTSASSGWYKSTPRIYEYTLHQLAADPEHVIHVGDSFRFDVQPAATLGIRTILVDWSGESIHADPALATIRHLEELHGHIPNGTAEHISCG